MSGDRFDTAHQLARDIQLGLFSPPCRGEDNQIDKKAEQQRLLEIQIKLQQEKEEKERIRNCAHSRVYESKLVI